MDEGKAVDVTYLDFGTVPHSILLERLAAHGLDGCTLAWVGNCPSCDEWSLIQLAASHKWCSAGLSFGPSVV